MVRTRAPRASEKIGIWHAMRRRLGRETTSGRFIPEIDGLRFPAIALVVLAHICATIIGRIGLPHAVTPAERPLVAAEFHGVEGVVLFFVISGFVLALPFARARLLGERPVRLRDYYLRRITRLEPPYLISLTLIFLAQVAARQSEWTVAKLPVGTATAHYLASAAYLHNLTYGYFSTINGVAWSLEVEVQFYVMMPLLALVFACRSNVVRRSLMLGAILIAILSQAYIPEYGRLSLSVVFFLQYFVFGFLLADLYLLDPAFSAPATRHGWDVVALAAWIALLLGWTGGDAGRILVPFAIFVAFVATFRSPVARWIFTRPLITTTGGMCYSIYLVHFWVIRNAEKAIDRFRPLSSSYWNEMLVVGLPALALALAASVAFFVLIERPCMDRTWPRRLAAWWRQAFVRKLAEPERVDA